MATSMIKNTFKSVTTSKSTSVTTSTTLAYTGISIEIAANRAFLLRVYFVYQNSAPQELYLSNSSSDCSIYNRVAGGETGGLSYCGLYPADTTLYIWAKHNGTSANNCWYFLTYLSK